MYMKAFLRVNKKLIEEHKMGIQYFAYISSFPLTHKCDIPILPCNMLDFLFMPYESLLENMKKIHIPV